jgi:hypothetical protein
MVPGMEAPDTLHGQLQRGRGTGYTRARTDPGAADLVYDCIRRDPRHDRQVESRRWYLSRLVTVLGLPAGPAADHLLAEVDPADDDEWRIDLASGVLADLAVRGDSTAMAALREYLRRGRHWAWVLDTLWEAGDSALMRGVDAIVLARADDGELRAAADPHAGPWSAWSILHPRVRAAMPSRGRSGRGGAAPSDGPSWTDGELADQVRTTRSRAALVELGRRTSPVVLDLAEEPALRNGFGVLAGLAPALRGLGAAAVPRARGWVAGADPFLVDHGTDVLAAHGGTGDVPALLRVLTAAAEREEWCAAEAPARGLGRLRAGAAAPVLRRLWAETGHSYARTAFLAGILGTAPHDADRYLTEAADDCEPGVRDLARAHGVAAP